jgi:hypothetical protein
MGQVRVAEGGEGKVKNRFAHRGKLNSDNP